MRSNQNPTDKKNKKRLAGQDKPRKVKPKFSNANPESLVNIDEEIISTEKESYHKILTDHFVFFHDVETIKYIVEYCKINLYKKYKAGGTPIHELLAHNKSLEIIKYVVEECNIDLYFKDIHGKTPLQEAFSFNHNIAIIKFLIKHCNIDFSHFANIGNDLIRKVFAKNQNLELIKYLVEDCKIDLNLKDDFYGNTLFFEGFRNPNLEIVKYLVEDHKVDLKFKNRFNETSIYAAFASNPNLDVIVYLIENCKIKLNQKSKSNDTPYHTAFEKNKNINILKYLVNILGNENRYCFNNQEENYLHMATKGNNLNAVILLCQSGYDVNIEGGPRGQTALHLALDSRVLRRNEIAKFLIQNSSCDKGRQDSKLKTPLHIAILQGKHEIMELLIQHSLPYLNLKTKDKPPHTPLSLAYEQRDIETIKLLVKYTCDLNQTLSGKNVPEEIFNNRKVFIKETNIDKNTFKNLFKYFIFHKARINKHDFLKEEYLFITSSRKKLYSNSPCENFQFLPQEDKNRMYQLLLFSKRFRNINRVIIPKPIIHQIFAYTLK